MLMEAAPGQSRTTNIPKTQIALLSATRIKKMIEVLDG
jgi:hypothetical protein